MAESLLIVRKTGFRDLDQESAVRKVVPGGAKNVNPILSPGAKPKQRRRSNIDGPVLASRVPRVPAGVATALQDIRARVHTYYPRTLRYRISGSYHHPRPVLELSATDSRLPVGVLERSTVMEGIASERRISSSSL